MEYEFIHFGLPLANHFAKGKYQLTFHPGDGFSPSLALEPMTKPKKIVPIDSWVQAFHVFVGPNYFLAKTDVNNAFRLVPIRPEEYDLLRISWQGKYHYERCMPMGCSSSCKTFEMFPTALEWIAQNKLHIPYILHLLDDFLIISPSNESCQHQLNTFVI